MSLRNLTLILPFYVSCSGKEAGSSRCARSSFSPPIASINLINVLFSLLSDVQVSSKHRPRVSLVLCTGSDLADNSKPTSRYFISSSSPIYLLPGPSSFLFPYSCLATADVEPLTAPKGARSRTGSQATNRSARSEPKLTGQVRLLIPHR
jgi:hypothetical protein